MGDALFPMRLGPPEPGAAAAAAAAGPAAHRPEYLLFVALMAWLDHRPERQQHKQQLLDCINFDRMNNHELAQMRSLPHVQNDDQLKELLLDAYARRCLQQSQQPLYHMQPLGERWRHDAAAAAPHNNEEDVAAAALAAAVPPGYLPTRIWGFHGNAARRAVREANAAVLWENPEAAQLRELLHQQPQQQPNQGAGGDGEDAPWYNQ
ncbi:hypothetical protein COO60DRAFT_772086 [Scenedesmus sp. NREL 46B-D3]|nr:hypothetical protein COO60DRAFT_772086 [Scenedesmus sp. NREL 46B-D3]